MGATFKVEIAGFEVLASSPVRWILREGNRPVTQTFDMPSGLADSLLERFKGKPVTLSITGPGTNLQINFLYVIEVNPGDHKFIKRVTLADRRVWWSYAHVLRRFNIRRNMGFQRIEDPGVNPVILPVVPRVWYAKWSLKTKEQDPPAAKFKAFEVLENVFKKVLSKEEEVSGISPPKVEIPGEIKNSTRNLPIENLIIDDPGDQAVQRALSFLPEAGVFIDYAGKVKVYSKVSGREENVMRQLQIEGKQVVGQGHASMVKNSAVRPKSIRVLFTREFELRFDYEEVVDTLLVSADDESRTLDNVLPLPDFVLPEEGGPDSLCQGTWATIAEALELWGIFPGSQDILNTDKVRIASMPFIDLWAAAGLVALKDPRIDWGARLASLQQHFRRTYRIRRRWIDKILTLRPYRVATVDRFSGQRAPAAVYMDFSVISTQRSTIKDLFDNDSAPYSANFKGIPKDGIIKKADAQRNQAALAPVKLAIVDHDQGVLTIDFVQDQFRLYEMYFPGMIEIPGKGDDAEGRPLQAGPSVDISKQKEIPIAFNAVADIHELPQLKKEFKMAIIVSAIPAAPNDNSQLHWVEVKPIDITTLLPRGARAGLGEAFGPSMEIRIGGSIETARIRWDDLPENVALIEKAFNLRNETIPDPLAFSNQFVSGDKPLVMNQATTTTAGASLNEISRAVAARIYASLADRYEGQITTAFDESLQPIGWSSEVIAELTPRGEFLSRMAVLSKIPQLDLFSFLDSRARAVILKFEEAGKST